MADRETSGAGAESYEPFHAEHSLAYLQAAWRNIAGSPHCVPRLALLGLVSLVPVLDVAVLGYALRWSRELSFGRRSPLPASPFADRAFLTRLLANVALIPYGIGLGLLLGALILLTSVLGVLVAVPVAVVFAVFADVCRIRMAVVGSPYALW